MFTGKKAEQEISHETFLQIVVGIGLLILAVVILFSLLGLFIKKPDFGTKYGFQRLITAIEEAPEGKYVFLPLSIDGTNYRIVVNDVKGDCRRRCLCLCAGGPDEKCKVIDKKCFGQPIIDASGEGQKGRGMSPLASPCREVGWFSSETSDAVNVATHVEKTSDGKTIITEYEVTPVFTVRILKEKDKITLRAYPKVTTTVISSDIDNVKQVLKKVTTDSSC